MNSIKRAELAAAVEEHEPFRGDRYREGGLMIWGFSHHKQSEEVDGADFTIRTIRKLALTGEHWFFNRIRRFFGDEEPEQFWHAVAFANSLPTTVPSGDRYSDGTDRQRLLVKPRVRRILTDLTPRKVVLFSTKGWELWPALNGSVPEPAQDLMTRPSLRYGTYNFGTGHEIQAYNLPHPQYQADDVMIERVKHILSH